MKTPEASAGQPVGLKAGAEARSAVSLWNWTLPSNGGSQITKYVVLREGIRLVTLTATPTGPLTYTDTGVASGTTHSYQVRAVNAIGSGQLSNTTVVTIP